jgi:hypothetical protein
MDENMIVKKSGLLIAVGAILILLIVALIYVRNTPPHFKVQPIPNDSPTLTTASVEMLLNSNFRVVRRVQQIPNVVKESFAALSGRPFAMVNPNQDMSTDMMLPGVPNKRLVFLGLSDQTAVIVFEQGGFASSLDAVVFSYARGGGTWTVTIDNPVQDISDLKRAVDNNRFTTFEGRAGLLQ